MGVSYSQPKMKTQLTMASQRLTMMINKQSNALRMDQKAVAGLLSAEKEESARIKTEGIILQKNTILAMEMIQLMCDLLRQRLSLVTSSKQCPADLEESIATLIYSSKRIECPELTEIGRMAAAKFGEEWARPHLTNGFGKVNAKIIKLTGVTPPPFEVVIEEMKAIATQFNVEWTPSLEKDDDEKDETKEHQKLGAMLPLNNKTDAKAEVPPPVSNKSKAPAPPPSSSPPSSVAAPPYPSAAAAAAAFYPPHSASAGSAASSASAASYSISDLSGIARYPGTANIVIYEAKELYAQSQTKADVYIRVASQSTGMTTSWKSSVCHFSSFGVSPRWQNEHFPIPVHDERDRLLLELHQVYGDGVIGYQVIPIQEITTLAQPKWFPLQRDHSGAYAGAVLLNAQYLPLHAPNPGAAADSMPLVPENVAAANFSEISHEPEEPHKPHKPETPGDDHSSFSSSSASSSGPSDSAADSAASSSSAGLPSIDDLEKRFQQLRND